MAAKTTRKKYHPDKYLQLTTELTNILNSTPHLRASRDEWDLEGDWSRAGTMHFIDSKYQSDFQRFKDFDCRTIKLVNLNKPAVRMTFNSVHKYKLIKPKDFTDESRLEYVNDYIKLLIDHIEKLKEKMHQMNTVKRHETEVKLKEMREELKVWSHARDHIEEFDMVLSNYHREHIYTNINWKYATGELEFEIGQEHLLTTTYDNLGNITTVKHNIVFVDSVEILRQHNYQNKIIDRYLKNFTTYSRFNKDRLYLRPRVIENNSTLKESNAT